MQPNGSMNMPEGYLRPSASGGNPVLMPAPQRAVSKATFEIVKEAAKQRAAESKPKSEQSKAIKNA